MANRIKLKRSNTGGSAPTTANIEVGEVAMNMADRLLYFRDPSNNILSFTIEDLNNFDTDDLTEGATNLYYTDTRVNANFSTKTTDALTEGVTNLYYTDGRARNAISATGDLSYNSTTGVISYTESVNSVNGATGVVVLDTDDVSEGATNQYYTDARVDAHLNTSTATSGEVLSWNGSDYDWVAASSGGLADVVDDTTPQLGGDLDLNSNNINGTGNINISGSITGVGMTNNATSFGEALIASRTNSSGTFGASFQNDKSTTLADGDFSTSAGFAIKPSTGSTAYPAFIHAEYHSITGNRLHFKMYNDGVSTFGTNTGLDLGANDAEFFDGDLTLSTDGTNQTIGSTTGNITLAPGTGSSQIIAENGFKVQSDGSTSDPYLQILNMQNTPGNYNGLGQMQWYGKNSTNGYVKTANIESYFTSDTAGSENSELAFRVLDGGVEMTPMIMNSSAVVVTGGAEYFFRNQDNGNAPDIKLNNTNSSIANNDLLGQIHFAKNYSNHAQIESRITDITGGSEDTNFEFYVKRNGSLQQYLNIGDGDRITPNTNVDINDSWLQIKHGSSIPTQYFYRSQNHGSGNRVGQTQYFGQDSFGSFAHYATIQATADDATSGSIQGSIEFQVADTGTMTTVASVDRSGIELVGYRETANPPGSSGTIAPDPSAGTYGVITLGGNITFNGFTNPIAGQSYTLVIKQPGSGGPYTLSSTMLFSGGGKTLSTAANAVDVMTVFYDGTSYYASLTLGYA